MANTINVDGQRYKKPSTWAVIGGTVAGSIVSVGINYVPEKIKPKIMNQIMKTSQNMSADEFRTINEAFEKAIVNTGLDKKGVTSLFANNENAERIKEIIAKDVD